MRRTLVPLEGNNWQWIDVEGPTKEELQELAEEYGLHRTSVIDSLQPEHLPKYEVIGDGAFMIARVYDSEAHREADTIQELTNKIAIFYSGKYIITIHRSPSDLIEQVKGRYTDTGVVKKPQDLLIRLIKGVFSTYETPAHRLAEELDYYEENVPEPKDAAPHKRPLSPEAKSHGVPACAPPVGGNSEQYAVDWVSANRNAGSERSVCSCGDAV